MFKTIYQHNKWEQIKKKLQLISSSSFSQQQLYENFTYFQTIIKPKNYRGQVITKKCFSALKQAFKSKEIIYIYSKIAHFILKMHHSSIPLFYKNVIKQYIFTKAQVILIMCFMTIFLVPEQIYHQQKHKVHQYHYDRNFLRIFQDSYFKSKVIMLYLQKSIDQYEIIKNEKLIIRRQSRNIQVNQLIADHQKQKMAKIDIYLQSSIEDYFGMLKVDFANKQIGGGCFNECYVQQQTMFVNHPELYIATLLCQQMAQNQALVFIGFKKYFKNKGYSHTHYYDGLQMHQYQFTQNRIANEYIVAIDSLCRPYYQQQFSKQGIDRQILKAFIGFNVKQVSTVATGNWGCGAFRCNKYLKLLIQWIAASLSNKNIIYSTFGDKELNHKKAISYISQKTVGQVYQLIINFKKKSYYKQIFNKIAEEYQL